MADIDNYTNYSAFTGGVAAACMPTDGPTRLGRIIVTAAVTGNLTIDDSNGGTRVFLKATPAAGDIFDLRFRTKKGAFVTPGSAGSCIVSWEA